MQWQVSKTVMPRPTNSGLENLLEKVVLGPLVLVVAAAVLVPLALVTGFYYVLWGWWHPAAPDSSAPAPGPAVGVLDTPTLRVELTDDDAAWSPELEQLWGDWDGIGDEQTLSLATTVPALPGLHGRLVTTFRYPWHGGLLLQVVEAAAGGAGVTSWLGWADPATQTWQRLVEVGPFLLYRSTDAPANVIEGWNLRVGRIRLELEPAPGVVAGL